MSSQIKNKIKNKVNKFLIFLIFTEINFRNLFIKKKTNRLLIVKIDAIGDFILFSPFIPAYADLYKNCKISIVVNSAYLQLAQKIFAPVSQIDKIIPFDQQKFNSSFVYKRRIFKTIRSEKSSVAIQPTFSRGYAGDLLIKSSEATERIGYDGNLSNISPKEKIIYNKFYTKLITNNNKLFSEIEINKHFMENLGGKIANPLPRLKITEAEETDAQNILEKNGLPKNQKYILIQLGAGAPYRQWPIARFAEITKYLTEKDFFCVISGSLKEKRLSIELLNKIDGNKMKIIDLVGKTNLIQLAAIAKNSTFYFGNETGTVHISAAVGTPTICILGGGHFGRFFPYGDTKKNRIIYDKGMKCMNDNWLCGSVALKGEPSPCIAGITIEQAKTEIDNILNILNL
jgi:ADP-heptose:LPS heptosyltransferase